MDGTRTILIVGEDAGASKTAKTLGFRAVLASRLQDAVAQVRSTPPSLVLVNLPGNALEPQWLRQLSKEACPILIVADPHRLPPPLPPPPPGGPPWPPPPGRPWPPPQPRPAPGNFSAAATRPSTCPSSTIARPC